VTQRKSKVLSSDKLEKAKVLLSGGYSRSEVARSLNVKYDTLSKAVWDGRVTYQPPSGKAVEVINETLPIDKSSRSQIDVAAGEGLGVACVRVVERVYSAVGLGGVAESRFERCNDVSFGGVLSALPALTANGLFDGIDKVFGEFKGYYPVTHILALLGFMALCRIKTVERLRWQPPGELGRLLGLDRIPEVKCLREKLTALSQDGVPEKWGESLSKRWMDDFPELAGFLYVDGHVRLYGGQEKIPKQYVSRQRLCMRGVMDFWVNDMLGRPFFVVRTAVNPGMLEVLRKEIVPRLLKDVPGQPSEQELESNPLAYRFVIVFDREGYSPEFFREMWTVHRVACITYHKYPKEDWNDNEFDEYDVKLVSGETTNMKLAERESEVGSGKTKVKVKEVRKLTASGHQTAIVTTAFALSSIVIAAVMFARWCQENFFNYMMKHFALDLLADYLKEQVPDTERVVSPEWRKLDKKINSVTGKLKYRQSRFGQLTLHPAEENDIEKYRKWEAAKSELAEDIHALEGELEQLKKVRASMEKYVRVSDLPEEEIFQQLSSSKKNLTDTVKMIAYRAETAMASAIAEECGSLDQARALVRDVFTSEADLIPDYGQHTLTVRLHNLSTRALDRKLDKLIDLLNDSHTTYPGTELILRYSRIGTPDEYHA